MGFLLTYQDSIESGKHMEELYNSGVEEDG